MGSNRILVGTDFTPTGEGVVSWAAAWCRRHDRNLTVVHAWSYPWWAAGPGGHESAASVDELPSAARRRLLASVRAHGSADSAGTECCVVEGEPAVVLRDLSVDADAVVLGSDDRHHVPGWMTGSVARRLAGSLAVPLIVVPDGAGLPGGPVVVGVDGSTNSIAALEWACQHACAGQEVRAVSCWTASLAHLAGVVTMNFDLAEDEARRRVEDAAQAVAGRSGLGRSVTTSTEFGDPREVLPRLAKDAAMLVVGTHGSTGLASLVLGSVTSALLHHPACPLVVVPG